MATCRISLRHETLVWSTLHMANVKRNTEKSNFCSYARAGDKISLHDAQLHNGRPYMNCGIKGTRCRMSIIRFLGWYEDWRHKFKDDLDMAPIVIGWLMITQNMDFRISRNPVLWHEVSGVRWGTCENVVENSIWILLIRSEDQEHKIYGLQTDFMIGPRTVYLQNITSLNVRIILSVLLTTIAKLLTIQIPYTCAPNWTTFVHACYLINTLLIEFSCQQTHRIVVTYIFLSWYKLSICSTSTIKFNTLDTSPIQTLLIPLAVCRSLIYTSHEGERIMADVVYKPSTPICFNKAQDTKLHLVVDNS